MPFQAAPNIAQLQCFGQVDGQTTINDLYFEISGGGITPINLNLLATDVSNWFGSALAPLLSDDWTTIRVVATDLTTETGPRVEVGAVNAGGVSGEANPNNVAACVSFRTDLRGRSARGRNYVPGIPGSVVTLNTLDPTFVFDLVSAYDSLKGPGTFSAGWEWVVLSRMTGGVLRANGVGFPITSVTMVGNSVRSMRSREIGHGS